ncbi:hypothetical protein CHH49_03995 [Terribacillus saccharophilus]|uniref:AAA family ATPase n=1 Tax=Terribacillus saccharophilus TaxID=361277 RepID=UPI000BA5C81E|nr:AAA family ATPase [Terribacillus saccharophilus]PAF22756.1 hypothetical protein CHH49_03995 [Terribacillus saccharophilus]
MYIKKLVIKNLYGKDYSLDFKKELNILVGMNGSGKTTILDIISHFCAGDIKKLLTYKFKDLIIDYVVDEIENKVKISSQNNEYYIEVNDNYHDLSEYSRNKIKAKESVELSSGYYVTEEEADGETVRYIRSTRNKLYYNTLNYSYIPLSRKIKQNFKGMQRSTRNKIDSNIDASTSFCEDLLKDYIKHVKYTENRIYNSTQKSLLRKFFGTLPENNAADEYELKELSLGSRELLTRYGLAKPYDTLVREYKNTLSVVENENFSMIENVDIYLRHLMYSDQLIKFEQILNHISGRHSSMEKLNKRLKTFINSINKFYNDTNKKLIIDQGDIFYDDDHGEIHFVNNDTGEKGNVQGLSSGEKQLFIILVSTLIEVPRITLNKRVGKEGKILLIDEPELSLHIDWQANLLMLLLENLGEQQVFVATHSPEIVGDYHKYCKVVEGLKHV